MYPMSICICILIWLELLLVEYYACGVFFKLHPVLLSAIKQNTDYRILIAVWLILYNHVQMRFDRYIFLRQQKKN